MRVRFTTQKFGNNFYDDLTIGRLYLVLGIESDDLRILNDAGRPYLYPAEIFEVIDPKRGSDWITRRGDDGEVYSYPPELSSRGFFEDYFDGDSAAVATFRRYISTLTEHEAS